MIHQTLDGPTSI